MEMLINGNSFHTVRRHTPRHTFTDMLLSDLLIVDYYMQSSSGARLVYVYWLGDYVHCRGRSQSIPFQFRFVSGESDFDISTR